MDFRLPPAGHFVNGILEEYEVKPHFAGKFAQSLAPHDPGSAACASSSVYFATSVPPRIASTNRSDDAASPHTIHSPLEWAMNGVLIATASDRLC